ncbi:hypothetical protein HMPREF2531_02916 [Bacteroides intestinalis]|uniref:Uncharacterized protein n=1 Tax=Bacteroides intestinalis TaxID=329854 RepID=A0A139LB10_9BACE|nr:hypothetical protein HMPREF2531_02916 [Bacteroides intestinalis]
MFYHTAKIRRFAKLFVEYMSYFYCFYSFFQSLQIYGIQVSN